MQFHEKYSRLLFSHLYFIKQKSVILIIDNETIRPIRSLVKCGIVECGMRTVKCGLWNPKMWKCLRNGV